jgi:DNA (cytosine-5)-methyltransferase 1
MRAPTIRASFLADDELIVDCFAGGGGASTGITWALGRDPDIAINHSAEALAMHAANHPRTKHFREDVWRVDPKTACGTRPVGLLWISPDCTHHSKAKGGKPRNRKLRALAWAAVRWAHDVRPRVICLENVEEFLDWGPLDGDGQPIRAKAGQTFRAFVRKLQRLGYVVEWRELVAADFNAPTTRRRLFLIARCDGQPIVWPEPTRASNSRSQLELLGVSSRLPPWRGAHEIIDWSIECPSIFDRKRPLAEATLRRIADGLRRYVIESPRPFVVGRTAPLFTKAYGGPNGNTNAGVDPRQPIGTITTRDHHWLVAARLTPFDRSRAPDSVHAFLVKYYGTGVGQSLGEPLHTITSRARFGLVTVHGKQHAIVDIGYRMLVPRELFNAQSFPPDYVIDPPFEGAPLTKTAQTMCVGNSVPPVMAEAIVGAQFGTREAVAA